MGNTLQEFEVLRYATLMEIYLSKKFGTIEELLNAYNTTKNGDSILQVMYEAITFDKKPGLNFLDSWFDQHREVHPMYEVYIRLVTAQQYSKVRRKDYPLIYSYKFLNSYLPQTNKLVLRSRYLYQRLQKISDRVRFPEGQQADDEFDPLLSRDGFYSWNDYLAYEIARLSGVED